MRFLLALKKTVLGLLFPHRPRGFMDFEFTDARGRVVRRAQGENVVTSWLGSDPSGPTSGRDVLRRLLISPEFEGALSAQDGAFIQYLELGTDGTLETPADGSEDSIPFAPALTGGHAIRKPVSEVVLHETKPWVTFVFYFTPNEVNTALREAVVFTQRLDPFARKTFQVPNDPNLGLTVKYTVRL